MKTTAPYTDIFYVIGRTTSDGIEEYLHWDNFKRMTFCYNESHAFMSRNLDDVRKVKKEAERRFGINRKMYIGEMEMIHRIKSIVE